MKIIRLFIVLTLISGTSSLYSRDMQDSEVITVQNASGIYRVNNSDIDIHLPNYIFSNSNTKIAVQFKDANNPKLEENNRKLSFIVNGTDVPLTFDEKGLAYIHYTFRSGDDLNIYFEDFRYISSIRVIPIGYVVGPIALIVALLAYRMMKTKKKKKSLDTGTEKEKENTTWTAGSKKETKLDIKKVVEEEEEVFS
ncbi:MAG: hypothetical protein ACJ76F_07400 [Bacteroidia bacterium]